MSLNSSMYAAVTGLSALGSGMQTISNNLANVNTVGFKAGRTNYEDLIYQNYFSGGRVNQRGCGVKISSIQSMFTQGAFMSSAQDTDMAIAGQGFFNVRNRVTGAINYTRAGVFTMDKDGYLEDPSGNILQGWLLSIPKPGQDPIRLGAPQDIKVTVVNAPPAKTTTIRNTMNLNADEKNAFPYLKDQLAVDYAHARAVPVAESARTAAELAIWNLYDPITNPMGKHTTVNPLRGGPGVWNPSNSNNWDFNMTFVKLYNDMFETAKNPEGTFDIQKDAAGNPVLDTSGNPVHWTPESMTVFDDETATIANSARSTLGWMTRSEFNSLVEQTISVMQSKAQIAGQENYTKVYNTRYNAEYKVITSQLQQWELEGSGFADVWNAQEIPPINLDRTTGEGEIVPQAITIYDSLGSEHKLMIYYQQNPIMENVWDYIITCDPLEDARKDGNLELLYSENASFSGLIQKGKITFSGDGKDRHGGVIKDIEAQNLDLGNCKMAVTHKPMNSLSATTLMKTATIGGYYTGKPAIDVDGDPAMYASTSRTYKIVWGGLNASGQAAYELAKETWIENTKGSMPQAGDPRYASYATATPVTGPADLNASGQALLTADQTQWNTDRGRKMPQMTDREFADFWTTEVPGTPPQSGFTVVDDLGRYEYVKVEDSQYAGPYQFGSGLTITFEEDMLPLHFGDPGWDYLTVSCSSEQIAWVNQKPNDEGLFDFDVAFVESASLALHPPYPTGMPTLPQHISMDMGARYHGSNPKWLLDDTCTTQWAGENTASFMGQDGFPMGSLQRLSIGEDGIVTGVFSNGRQQSLYMIGLTNFINPWGLSKEGDNLFAETRWSGTGVINPPGFAGTGTILANFLEQSNVDVAEEIVNMILTQRGFQANSKTVTTTDSMLSEVIEMKR